MKQEHSHHNLRSEDAAALSARTRINNECGSFDLAAWIRESARIGAGARLLDVGSGTGRLLMDYGAAALRDGNCLAVDVSRESLDQLEHAARRNGGSRLDVACCDMDELADPGAHPHWTNFTHIVSAYALYYSAAPLDLLHGLSRRLAPEGSMIVVAPAAGNNAEWFAWLRSLGITIPPHILAVATFLDDVVLPFARSRFRTVTVDSAVNTVRFRDPLEIDTYWRSNIYFDPATADTVHSAAHTICERGGLVNQKIIGLVTMSEQIA